MAIQINFDSENNVRCPTFVLATRSGKKLGYIPATNVTFKDGLNTYSETSFSVNKISNGTEYHLWNQLKDFKLIWCKDWDMWFEIKVQVNEDDNLTKSVVGVSLGEAELSQINLYDIEINTEDDIARTDYYPTVLFNDDKHSASLLHRIMEKVPHYKILHVDSSIAGIQRTFQFNAISVYDAFQEISKEINCIFIIDSSSDKDGNIVRGIYVYDLESYCLNCGCRNEFTGICPECESTNITTGYGKDTSIFISTDNLADEIHYSTDVGSVKNCFKLVGGDDLMTATIINCNPNGSGYIWYISDELKEDMSSELVSKLKEYDAALKYYQEEFVSNIDPQLIATYNNLIDKYSHYSDDLERIPDNIAGHTALMTVYYNTIDFDLFLSSGLMPDSKLQDTDADTEAAKLTAKNLSPVAVTNISTCSAATAGNAVLSVARTIVDSRYQVKINSSSYSNSTWKGTFIVTNYSDEEDACESPTVSIEINDDYEKYVQQKLEKSLADDSNVSNDILSIFKLDSSDFSDEMKKYSLSRLISFNDACQSCLNILIEQGIANKDTWADSTPNLYEELYVDYHNKLITIQEEIKTRESEIAIVVGTYDNEGNLQSDGMQSTILKVRNDIQHILDFESFLGNDLWLELSSYRREDTYENTNYVSDGLDNAKLFESAQAFLNVANKEILKSATMQHSISASLKNLLVMREFKPILDGFMVGNWIRIKTDESVYRLRIVNYDINFDMLDSISITFSDVRVAQDDSNDIESILNQATSISSSYSAITRQAEQGKKSNQQIENWFEKGLSLSTLKIVDNVDNQNISWDSHGMLFRKYDDMSGEFDDCQLKIVNSTISITDDSWNSVKTAIGKYYYFDANGKLTYGYGVNAETIIGELIIGEKLFIYNNDGKELFSVIDEKISLASHEINIKAEGETGTLQTIINNNGEWTASYTEDGIELSGFNFDFNSKQFIFNGAGNFTGSLNIGNGSFIVDNDGEVTTYGSVKILKDSDTSRYSGFYAYGGANEATSNYTTMEPNGMSIYTYDGVRRVKLGFPTEHPESPYMVLNGGLIDNASQIIMKQFSDGVWIGSDAVMNLYGTFSPIEGCNGFFISLLDETVYVVSGTEMQNVYLGEAVAKFG